nr:hypothetical protein [Tanacetum cinerariifolium]
MMTWDQFFELEKDNPHDHIRWGSSYKDILRACPHHGFTELHQLDTFYNAFNPADQDSLNSAAGGNLLERRTKDVLTIIENKPKCLTADGNTFLELRDNIQGYIIAAAVNYNQDLSLATPLKAITTRSGIVLDGPSIPIPLPFINPKEDERVEETLTDQDLIEYAIKVPPPLKMLKALLSNKEKLLKLANTPLNENCSAVILKKLPEKLRDLGKFLISCDFSELKCKALANLANRAICTPAGIARDVFVPVGKFTFPADFVIFYYESDPRFPLILGRPFLQTALSLIDVHGEEMILRDDLHPPHNVNPFSGSTTSSSSPNHLLEEFADELALITFPLEYDDDLTFDIESNLKEIEYLLYHNPINDMDPSLKDPIDQSDLIDLNDNFVDTMLEMLIDEHALDYLSPSLYDEYDDDFFKVESNTKNVYDDPFDSKGEKIKESKLLINELDLHSDFLPFSEYDLFLSENFSKVDAFPSTNNEDKVFNLSILIQENLFEVITRVAQKKWLAISHASLILEDFDHPLYELSSFKEVPRPKTLLSFSSENERKVFKPGILTFKEVYSSLIPELSHQGNKVFKINQILKSLMKIFFSLMERTSTSWMFLVFTFTLLDQLKYGEIWVKLSDPKQALRGRHLMLILDLVMNKMNSWILKIHAGFCHSVFTSLASFGNDETDMIKRDKIQAKPDKTEQKTESVE